MKKTISLAIALLLVAMGVSACPKVSDRDTPTFVARHSSHTQLLGGKSGLASIKGHLIAALRSHGVVLVVKDDGGMGDGGKGDNPK